MSKITNTHTETLPSYLCFSPQPLAQFNTLHIFLAYFVYFIPQPHWNISSMKKGILSGFIFIFFPTVEFLTPEQCLEHGNTWEIFVKQMKTIIIDLRYVGASLSSLWLALGALLVFLGSWPLNILAWRATILEWKGTAWESERPCFSWSHGLCETQVIPSDFPGQTLTQL